MENLMVKTENLWKCFGNFVAVKALDLKVAQGEVFAFLGPNGAGKTTTILMLMGILQPLKGSASIRGYDCFRERAKVMGIVGYLPDDPVFYDYLRGREVIQFVGEMHGLSKNKIEARSGPLVERFDLNSALNEFAVNYSRGMKKKLGMICALLHDPAFLILDEPTNGLDPYASRVLHEIICEKSAKGTSIFFSTHLLDQAEKLCNRVGILYKAEMVAVGTINDLKASLAEGGSLEDVFFAVTSQENSQPGKDDLRKIEMHGNERRGESATESEADGTPPATSVDNPEDQHNNDGKTTAGE